VARIAVHEVCPKRSARRCRSLRKASDLEIRPNCSSSTRAWHRCFCAKPFCSASSLVALRVRSGNSLELLVCVTCSAPLLKSVRNAPLGVVARRRRSFRKSSVLQIRSALLESLVRVTCSAPSLKSVRNAPLGRPFHESARRCSNRLSASHALLELIFTKSIRNALLGVVARSTKRSFREFVRITRIACPRHVLGSVTEVRPKCSARRCRSALVLDTGSAPLLGSRNRLFGCRLLAVLASFTCQLDSAKVFTERRRLTGPDIAGPRAYR